MTLFQEKIEEIREELEFEFTSRQFEIDEYIKQGIELANQEKDWTLDMKMDLIREYAAQQLEKTRADWEY